MSPHNGQGFKRALKPGTYVPLICPFDKETEDVDVDTLARHAVRLAEAGVAGVATQGSNGEAVHLTHEERVLVTATVRKALDDAGHAHMPVMVGCGGQSTRETIQYCREAQRAGGDFALVLSPSYYASLYAPAGHTVERFFTDVADASPIPLVLYNFPGAAGGIDLDSDMIVRLAKHPNIVGVKLTCGNTGKMNRVVVGTRDPKNRDAEETPLFLVLAGSADFAIPALATGGHGMLAGLGNLAPRACVRVVELWQQGRTVEARALQDVLAQGDAVAIRGGVVGVKAGLQVWAGYGGWARKPLPRPDAEEEKGWGEAFRELMEVEKACEEASM